VFPEIAARSAAIHSGFAAAREISTTPGLRDLGDIPRLLTRRIRGARQAAPSARRRRALEEPDAASHPAALRGNGCGVVIVHFLKA
jgi:hypothetical protein